MTIAFDFASLLAALAARTDDPVAAAAHASLRGLDERLHEYDALAACGMLAAGVAGELAQPLANIQEILAAAVDQIDHHVAGAKGPEALPWPLVGLVREKLADAYLDLGRAARLAADLAAVISPPSGADLAFDANDVVERAVALARHHTSGEIHLDLGTLPSLQGDSARLAQAIAHLLVHAAQRSEGGTIDVCTRRDGGHVLVTIAFPATEPGGEPAFAPMIREIIAAEGGSLALRAGGVEIRLPARRVPAVQP